MLRPGIYEQVIDCRLAKGTNHLLENLKAMTAIDPAEASLVLSQYVEPASERCDNCED